MRRPSRRAASALAIGSLVVDRYRIEEKLGEGGMAEVFRALDEKENRTVAVKVLHPEVATNPEAVERTRREGQVLQDLHNPAIVNVETYGELPDGTVFLVMELLEGETLGERMRRGALEWAELAPIVAGTCAGLHAAHTRKIVHRDLKPDNIFLCPTEHGLQVKLLDFGISKVYGEQKLTQTGEVLGTPRYMSPEQLGAEPDVDPRVDVYALGVILYEALAGKPPFLANTPTDLIIAILNGKVVPLKSARPDVPPAVEAVVMRAMSKVRNARYDTAMALAEAYVDAVGGSQAVRGQQRRGMATVAMGGMKAGALAKPSAPAVTPGMATAGVPRVEPAESAPAKLKIGTFSGLGNVPPAARGTQQMGASPGGHIPPEQRAIPATASPEDPNPSELQRAAEAAMPHTREMELRAQAVPATPATARPVAATAMMDTSQAFSVPPPAPPAMPAPAPPAKSGGALGRVLLVIGALIAGAASAGGVIFALRSLEPGADDAAGGTEPPPVEAVAEQSEDAGPETTPVGVEAPDVHVPAPEATEPEEVEPAPETTGRRTQRRRSRRTATTEEESSDAQETGDGDGTPVLPGFGGGSPDSSSDNGGRSGGSTPADPLSRARAEQRAGHPLECVRILDDAIRSGASAIALRRRADCYEAAGDRAHAIRDYQRFCRLVPDHPSISEVRPLLASWGQSCP